MHWMGNSPYIDGLVQDCSISIANTLEILQSCAKPSICCNVTATGVDYNGPKRLDIEIMDPREKLMGYFEPVHH